MFYSHEILTSREGGVATVWLVATLGSKSNLKKVNRKAILDVDVPKTCSIIIQPEAPMALRLQSNLLYGVSRVFSQQCGYVLTDAQIAQSNIRALIRAVRTSGLDPNAGKTRPDQLVIQDDPAFLPDLALPGLDIDMSALEISTDDSSRRSSFLSAFSQRSSTSSHQEVDKSMLGLVIPTSDSGGMGDLGGFILPGENASSAQHNAGVGHLLGDEEEVFNIDPGFTIDADGNLIEERTNGPGTALPKDVSLGSNSAASRQFHEEQLGTSQNDGSKPGVVDLDLDLPKFDDDDFLVPAAEPFPTMAFQSLTGEALPSSLSIVTRRQDLVESAEAPVQRKRRVPKELEIDDRQELHNADLAQWTTDYAINMSEAANVKLTHKAHWKAKKNATFWVVGSGIGCVGARLGTPKFKSPLDMFAGNAFMGALTGLGTSRIGQKRVRDDEEDQASGGEERQVRMRNDNDEEIGRGNDPILNDDNTIVVPGSEGIELGRHAQAPLEDPSFPWNVSTSARVSRQGSFPQGRGFASSLAGFPTSAGRPSSLPGIGSVGPGLFERRISRTTSASPLIGRGPEHYGSLELPLRDDEDNLFDGHVISSDQAFDDFRPYGSVADVSTQTAAQSRWLKATLHHEANNFLEFVKAEIAAIPPPADDEEDELSGDARPKSSVSFEGLLPPAKHTKIVAAQALHHALALASKSLLNVRQTTPYGPIELAAPVGA